MEYAMHCEFTLCTASAQMPPPPTFSHEHLGEAVFLKSHTYQKMGQCRDGCIWTLVQVCRTWMWQLKSPAIVPPHWVLIPPNSVRTMKTQASFVFFIAIIKRITGLQNLISIYLLYSGSIWETALYSPISRSQPCNTNSISATSQTSDSFSSWLEILQVWLLLAWLVHRPITLTPYSTCQRILKQLHVNDFSKVSLTEINKQLYLKNGLHFVAPFWFMYIQVSKYSHSCCWQKL